MAVRHGYGKIAGADALVFAYDTGDTRNSYRGEPTTNLIPQMAATIGGNTSLSYPQTVYISTALETNVVDPTAPGGQYSRFVGNTESANNQLYTTFNAAGIDVRNSTITYSVYLKGSGTCHLTIYADNAGYGTSPDITLTSEWTRYTYTSAVTNYTTNCWVAVRGLYPTTNVYVAAQQAEIKSHATQFVNGTRSATQGLLDLTGNNTVNLVSATFDSNAQIDLDGTNTSIYPGTVTGASALSEVTLEIVCKSNANNKNLFLTAGNALLLHYGGAGFYLVSSDNVASGYLGWNNALGGGAGVYEHLTATWDGSTMKLYVNGQQTASDRAFSGGGTGVLKPFNNATLGGYFNSTQPNFNGKIDVAKIYNRALSSAEVANNYRQYKSRFNL